jgi:hypothetical protein
MATCPNGHPNLEQARFCSICGVVMQGHPLSASVSPQLQDPPILGEVPSQVHPQFAQVGEATPGSGRSKKVIGLAIGGGILAIAVLLIVVVLLRGGQSYEPLTTIQAERALLQTSDLSLNFILEDGESSLEENSEFDPELDRDCTVVAGVRRLTDIPPNFQLGGPAFPIEAKNIIVFAGVDFKNPDTAVVTSLDERILVFPTGEEATAYMDSIETALAACPRSSRGSSGDGFAYQIDDRHKSVLRYDDGQTLTYEINSDFTSESDLQALNLNFSSVSKVMVVQRGPNVMVADWYLDEDDRLSPSQLDVDLELARTKFIEAAEDN